MRFKYAMLAVALSVAAACAQNSGVTRTVNGVQIAEDKTGLWDKATFPADSAVKIALARVPGGTISKAELEEEDGLLIYSFEIKVAGKSGENEIHVDARTGQIVKEEQEG